MRPGQEHSTIPPAAVEQAVVEEVRQKPTWKIESMPDTPPTREGRLYDTDGEPIAWISGDKGFGMAYTAVDTKGMSVEEAAARLPALLIPVLEKRLATFRTMVATEGDDGR